MSGNVLRSEWVLGGGYGLNGPGNKTPIGTKFTIQKAEPVSPTLPSVFAGYFASLRLFQKPSQYGRASTCVQTACLGCKAST